MINLKNILEQIDCNFINKTVEDTAKLYIQKSNGILTNQSIENFFKLYPCNKTLVMRNKEKFLKLIKNYK